MKKIATIIISFMLMLSYMVIGNQVEAENGSISSGVLIPITTPSPAIPATTPTVYKDWSEITKIDKDYSHSTMFYRENTRIQILKNGGTASWKTTNGITFPEVTLHTGQEAILLITNCAIDKDGRNQDVVIKINNVHEWGQSSDDKIYITFWRQEFLNSQTNLPGENGYDYVRNIAVGELINFDLEAHYSECDFNMTYYVSGTYSYDASSNTERGVLGNITSVNNFVYDIDVPKKTNRFIKKIFQGNEGLIPFTGDPTIYHTRMKTTADSYNTGLQELQGGICVNDSIDRNLDAIWYKNSAFITANNLKNSTYSFRYGGEGCGIVYCFTSPYPYETEAPSKTVSKTKVKEQESFNYTISQYIPNNYYGSLIKFNEIYSNLYGDTHFTNVEISDTLNENLAINGNITITDDNGEDKSDFFDIIVSGNSVRAVAKSSVLNQVDFYARVYNINIPVYIKSGTGSRLTGLSTIENKAHLTAGIEGENINLDTNTVSTELYYDITTSMENGSITASTSADIHTNKTITLTPNQGYYVYSITIDGVEQDVSNYYDGGTINLPDITKDYNIVVKTKAYGQAQITKRNTLTTENLEGAVIGLYYDTTCQTPVEGKEGLITGASGTVLATRLREGTYYAKEIQAPNNYTLNNTIQKITIYSGQTTPILVENMPNMAKIEVNKLDNNTGKIITKEDTTFALYEWSEATKTWVAPTHISEGTVNGTAPDGIGAILSKKNAETKGIYTATMYYNAQNQGKYKVIEAVRPLGYTTTNWETEIQITEDNQLFSYLTEVRNEEVKAQINFKKNDSQVNYKNVSYGENYAQTDATLQGASYGLYAKEDILSPDDGSVLYHARELITIHTTDQEGKITWDNLYLGKYYIQEQTPPTGYVKDETEYEVDLQNYYYNTYFTQGNQTTQNIIYKNTAEDPQYENLEQRVIIKENVIKQSFQLTKLEIADDSNMGNPLQGAGFKIYLISELSKVKDGSIKPDANGNYKASDFLLYDFSKEQTAMTFNENANGERIPELFSNEDGILISPELAYGKYVVIESTTPENVKTVEPFLINIQEDSRTPKKMIYPLDREFEARIEIVKKDNTTGKRVLKENAAYRIWDVTNNQYVEQWVTYPNKVKYGTEKNPYKTSKEGYLLTPEVLGIGEYELREVGAPEGYVVSGKEEMPQSNVRFSIGSNSVYEIDPDLGKRNAIIIVEQMNTPQVGTITVEKKGEFLSNAQEEQGIYQIEYTKRQVKDAKFAIYAKEDIYTQDNQGDKIYSQNQLIKEVETNNEGKAVFEKLPLGKYYIAEIKAGEGFVLNEEEKEVELSYKGQEEAIIYEETNYINQRPKIEIAVTKKDSETEELIQGAEFGLYTKEAITYIDNNGIEQTIPENKLIAKTVSGQNGVALFNDEAIPLGKYYVQETNPADGYIENTQKIEADATFIPSVEKQYPIQIEMHNQKTHINVEKIEKVREEPEEGVKGEVEKEEPRTEEDIKEETKEGARTEVKELEKEETESVKEKIKIIGATLQILDEEGKVVHQWITEDQVHEIKGLEVEKQYSLHEAEPGKGYVSANDIKFSINKQGELLVEENYMDKEAEIPTIIMQDETTKVKIIVVDKETKEPVKDIVVQVIDKETKEVVYEFTTDGEEKIIEKIPIGNYEIIEKDFPKEEGYVSIETEELEVQDTPEVQEKIIEQDYTKLDISFIDEITKDLLPGGKLEIKNEEGKVVATIDKTEEHTYIERLPAGKYSIVETEVPEGYEPIEEIKFTLEDTPQIQYVVIENKRLPFDLSVEKYASEVLVNGEKQTGANKVGQLVKIEVDGKKIAKQDVQITYTIKVTNTGKVAGAVGEIVDKVPLGLTFDPSKNENYWNANGNTIVSTAFAETKIQPEENIELKIVLDWVRSDFNLGEKENIVTIGEFSNGPGFEDEEKENNQSSSSILLSVKTGLELVLTNQITALILLELCGIAFIAIIEIVFLNKKRKTNK